MPERKCLGTDLQSAQNLQKERRKNMGFQAYIQSIQALIFQLRSERKTAEAGRDMLNLVTLGLRDKG